MLIMGIELFHHHDPRVKLVQDAYYTIVQIRNPMCHLSRRSAFGTADDACLADDRLVRTDFDDRVTGDLQAGIHAEDPLTHGLTVLDRWLCGVSAFWQHAHVH